ncbi:peptidyl-tRNA hydrolase ICT1, mitochondrial [Carlito syrichta]|uniref:Large ribosomal subunit protein mL62 n=1 Tax=Carlito syrichta TaxID=1868482 RepID=A0A1U7UH14_CARSF|nr:peptidyl-tRNA hydrolase ICT1, mitochondrial [Carlito syrichta]
MAATWCLRWGLSRAGARLLPPPARCPRRALHKQVDDTEFKSIYSLDKVYPESRGLETAWRLPVSQEWQDGEGVSVLLPVCTFCHGIIHFVCVFFFRTDRLTVSYCRSSGPGGQNVNKVNSKAEVRFHLASADWIAEPVRQRIAITHKNKINRSGELILTSESSRYQFRNLADCLQKIRDMIADASQTPKEPSKEDTKLQRIRIENMNRERLRQKRIHSAIKTNRRADVD